MNPQIRVRIGMIVAAVIAGLLFIVPTVSDAPPEWLAAITPESGAKLGLDLQGGMHLVLSVDVDEAVHNRIRNVAGEVERWIAESGLGGSATVTGPTSIRAVIPAGDLDDLRDWVEQRGDALEILGSSSSGRVSATVDIGMIDQEVRQIKDWAVLQSLETIRNRIDQYGVSEPSIQRQGDTRIVIQLPGVEDPQRAINLIGQTAQLTFHMYRDDLAVNDLATAVEDLTTENPDLKQDIRALNAALAATLPTGVSVRWQRVSDEYGSFNVPVLVDSDPRMSGDTIIDARVRIDQQFNEPYVLMSFNSEGAEQFEQVTEEYVGRRFAIVLDDIVYSAPVIREKISGGRASIEGGFTIDEARDLAIVLRAGSLPAPVSIEEERTVGPSLGQDSIQRGIRAIAVGGVIVLIFMMIYYLYGGLVANISLAVNLIMLLAMMSMFEATLTLPGLAGIVLTIGMAVDGNVIIFERIREELRLGRSVRAAVDSGFSKATWTVLDANITTLIAGVILFQFGTGPVRGFAVTLTVGIMTTLFSVLVVSRVFLDAYVQRRGVKTLPI